MEEENNVVTEPVVKKPSKKQVIIDTTEIEKPSDMVPARPPQTQAEEVRKSNAYTMPNGTVVEDFY